MSVRNHLPSLFRNQTRGDDLFNNLHTEIDKVFGQFRDGWPNMSLDTGITSNNGESLMPRVNISETDEAVEIEAELPGFKAEDIEVTSQQRALIIEANRSSSINEKDKNYHVVERSSGSYRRIVPLDFEIDAESIKALCKDGVLTVTVGKPAAITQSVRKIEVETA